MKCLDIVITVPIRVEISTDDPLKRAKLHKKSVGLIEEYLVYLEKEFNNENWPYYHSATYRYENESLVIRLVAYTDILSIHLLKMELFPHCRGYSYNNLHIYIDVDSLEVNIDLPYDVHYINYMSNSTSEALRQKLETDLLESEYYKDVKVEFLKECIAVGVILYKPSYRPPTGFMIKSFLMNNC